MLGIFNHNTSVVVLETRLGLGLSRPYFNGLDLVMDSCAFGLGIDSYSNIFFLGLGIIPESTRVQLKIFFMIINVC